MRFADIVGLDYEPGLRALALAMDYKATLAHVSGKPVWKALVLADDGDAPWPVGQVVTFLVDVPGFVVYDEGEEAP